MSYVKSEIAPLSRRYRPRTRLPRGGALALVARTLPSRPLGCGRCWLYSLPRPTSRPAELAAALGRPADSAQQDALELLDVLRAGVSTTAALGIWRRKDIPLHEDWASQLPEGVVGTLTDQAALDRWAADETGGLIDKFPLAITADTLLMIASALAARVRWRTPFYGYPRDHGSAEADPAQQWLRRTTFNLAPAAVLDATVTRIVVEGDGDLDVHLLLGDQQPVDVLATGLRELSGEARVHRVADLDVWWARIDSAS